MTHSNPVTAAHIDTARGILHAAIRALGKTNGHGGKKALAGHLRVRQNTISRWVRRPELIDACALLEMQRIAASAAAEPCPDCNGIPSPSPRN